jgi:hypothetical protein
MNRGDEGTPFVIGRRDFLAGIADAVPWKRLYKTSRAGHAAENCRP